MTARWTSTTQIIRATCDHVADLARLDALVFDEDPYTELIWRQMLDLAGPLAAVAMVPGGSGIVGFAIVAPTWTMDTGWLTGLGVDPDFRRRGIGTALTRHVVARSLEHGISTIRLTVDPGNSAISLYRRMGFSLESSDPNYFGKGRERMVMCLHGRPTEEQIDHGR